LGNSLAQFETLRNELNKSNAELATFHEKFTKMQSEYISEVYLSIFGTLMNKFNQIETLKLERDELQEKFEKQIVELECKNELDLANYKEEMSQQIDHLRAELKEREEELQRMRGEKLVVSTIPTEEEFKVCFGFQYYFGQY
jgi:Na+-translocating ferredoxin:NAD+ oxidoreductase RnfC subunit